MKRFFLMSTLLLAALLAGAQTKVTPKMKKGMKKTYLTEAVLGIPMKQPVKITTVTTYEVMDASADGYTLDVFVSDVTTDAKDAEGRFYSVATEMLKGVHTRYVTDNDGKVVGILDVENIKNRTNQLLDSILSKVPLPETTSASDLRKQLTGEISEESLLQSVMISTSPLTLNGKTIAAGTEEEYVTKQANMGLKMKRTYTVEGDGSIKSVSKLNMNEEDMKGLLTNLLGKLMPNMPEGVNQYLDSMLKNIKIESDEQSNYSFQKDGWVKNISSEMNTSCMGQTFTIKTTVKLK